MVVLRDYERHIRIMREDYKLSYAKIGSLLGVSRWTISRIYRKRSKYVASRPTRQRINKFWKRFMKRRSRYIEEGVVSNVFSGKKPYGYKIRAIKAPNAFYGYVAKYFPVGFVCDADTDFLRLKSRLVDLEKRVYPDLKGVYLGGYATFKLSYFTDDETMSNCLLNTYYFDLRDGGMETALLSGVEAFLESKLIYDNYKTAVLHGVYFNYKIPAEMELTTF